MKTLLLITLILGSFSASAKTKQMSVLCEGHVGAALINAEITFTSIFKSRSFKGKVLLDGHEVSLFDHGTIKVKKLSQKFRGKNQRGDVIEGKLLGMDPFEVKMLELSIPGLDVNGKNFLAKCKWGRTVYLDPAAEEKADNSDTDIEE